MEGFIVRLSRRPAHYSILYGLLSVGVVFFCVDGDGIRNQLDVWQLLPRPERLTELYFTSQQLPRMYLPDAPQTVAFTIHNSEHRTTEYHYMLLARTENKKQILSEGSLTLVQDDSRNISQTISVPPLDSHQKIEVGLVYSGIRAGLGTEVETQTISYWINKVSVVVTRQA